MKYKPVVKTRKEQYSACALVGRNSVSLGWSVKQNEIPENLLGFAVKKTDIDESGEIIKVGYLKGQKRFESYVGSTNIDIPSDVAPFQRFRWNDYSINPSHSYKYEIFPIVGTPTNFAKKTPMTLKVVPASEIENDIGIYTNRGVTSAKSYYKLFGDTHPKNVHNNSAYLWLSNGLKEGLIKFINQVKPGDCIHISIYELHDEEIIKLLKEKSKKGIELHILYHYRDDNASRENHELLKKYGLLSKSKERTSMSNLSHNKFVIILRNNKPFKLWTGTANFSEAGFYFQTNIGLVIENKPIVELYEAYFQIIYKNKKQLRKKKNVNGPRDKIDRLNKTAEISLNGGDCDIFFSPIRGKHILDKAKEMIKNAKRSVFISSPFGLDLTLSEELNNNKNKVLEYGLISHTNYKRFIKKLDPNNNTRFFKPTKLGSYMGVRWDSKGFGNHKIHSKFIICDAWSRNPKILIGSANFSDESCQKNDENAIYIEGDRRLAACLTTDFMRMFDHYKSRFYINKFFSKNKNDNYKWLKEDSSWTNIYYKESSKSHKYRDRQVFVGKR